MASYEIKISSSAEKSLKKIPKEDLPRVIETISSLAANPFLTGSFKIKGEENTYRVRRGKYRIIYEVQGKLLLILVLKIGHRKDIYTR